MNYVKQALPIEDEKDQSLISTIIPQKDLSKVLNGFEDFSDNYIILEMGKISNTKISGFLAQEYKFLLKDTKPSVGIFAIRAPIHPNPIGLTLVEFVKREKNVLRVKSLDAYGGTLFKT